MLRGSAAALAALPIDHGVGPSPHKGGAAEASRRLAAFVSRGLPQYAEHHAQPEPGATSTLSPYLHFGHIAAHEVFSAVMTRERWTTRRLAGAARGAREGWWGVSAGAEAFLDQLVTWRELGFNGCVFLKDYDRYASLPAWARRTLDAHARDPRPVVYTADELDAARTHDPLWNAAQRHMVREGWFPNYLRMLWGKKILEWSRSQHVLGHFLGARPLRSGLGPERDIFDTVRYMSSENTARKLRTKDYVRCWGA